MQETLQNLGQAEGEGLEKICFAPITLPGEITKLDQCTVQSIFGYFQNDYSFFGRVAEDAQGDLINYLNVIAGCTSNSYNIDCLAKFGGPVEPGVAVGGMPRAEGSEF